MNTPRFEIPPPPPEIVFLMVALATLLLVLALVGCSGATPNGPIAFAGNQSMASYKSKQYYETGALKSTMEIEGYVSVNPNPELTDKVGDIALTGIATKGLVDITEATVLNPNQTPALAKDPNTLKRNPNVTVKDVNSIPLNPNVIPH